MDTCSIQYQNAYQSNRNALNTTNMHMRSTSSDGLYINGRPYDDVSVLRKAIEDLKEQVERQVRERASTEKVSQENWQMREQLRLAEEDKKQKQRVIDL